MVRWLSGKKTDVMKVLSLNFATSNEALKPGFGARKNFVQSSKNREDSDVGITNYNYVQELLT